MSDKLNIKDWDSQDRPREKMMAKGADALTDAELLAILIRSGTVGYNALEVGQSLLRSANGDLNQLARMSHKDMMKTKGLGETKAIGIAAALELGRRRQRTDGNEKRKITSSRDAYDIIGTAVCDLLHEEFWAIFLDRANQVIRMTKISQGGIAGTVVDPRLIFKPALENLASGIILVHNHPSGNLRPSQADIDITRKLKIAGTTLEIPILDHLIIAGKSYFSFADDGMM